jgi:hypothetical protein
VAVSLEVEGFSRDGSEFWHELGSKHAFMGRESQLFGFSALVDSGGGNHSFGFSALVVVSFICSLLVMLIWSYVGDTISCAFFMCLISFNMTTITKKVSGLLTHFSQ